MANLVEHLAQDLSALVVIYVINQTIDTCLDYTIRDLLLDEKFNQEAHVSE